MKVSELKFENVGCCEIHTQARVAFDSFELFVNEIGKDLYSITVFKDGKLANRLKSLSKSEVETAIKKLKT